MAIKKISDSVKLESLNEMDTLLVNHDGVIAQIAGDNVGEKTPKPVRFYMSTTAGCLLGPDNKTPATIDEVLSAYFAGVAYVSTGTKINGFRISSGSDTVFISADEWNGTTTCKISGLNSAAFLEKFNAYFA